MEPEARLSVGEIVSRLRTIAPQEHAEFLERACGEAGQLREAVEAEIRRLSADQTRTRPPQRFTADGAISKNPTDFPESVACAFPGYRVIRELSHGGQGAVYQAIQLSTKRKVAIKVLLEGKFTSPDSRKRFEREVETMAQLDHPDIISIFEANETADGRPFYVMDYVRGSHLNRYIRAKKLTLIQTLGLFARICRAIHHAHLHGIVHRDLKPSNILVDDDGNPKILDFGLAKWLAGPADSGLTLTRVAIGTPQFMAPEQTRNDPDTIDARTDVYTLGVLLYLLLTGQYPYPTEGSLHDLCNHIIHTRPIPPEKNWNGDSGISSRGGSIHPRQRCPIDREVRTIILAALAKERERRYQSAADFAADIEHYLAGRPILARGDSLTYLVATRTRTLLRRHKLVAYLLTIWAAAFVTDAVIMRSVYELSSFNQQYERMLASMFSSSLGDSFNHVRVVTITDDTDVELLAREANVEGVTTTDACSLRRLHGRLMEKLTNGRPKAVAWDIAFPSETSHDGDFVRGVETLGQAGIDVVVATLGWGADDHGMPQLSENIAPHVRWGCITVGLIGRWGLDLCLRRGESEAAPSLALATLAAVRQPTMRPSWRLDTDRHLIEVEYQRPLDVAPLAGKWGGSRERVRLTEAILESEPHSDVGIESGDWIGTLATPMPPAEVLHNSTVEYQVAFRADQAQLRKWFADKVVLVGDTRKNVDQFRYHDGRQIAGCMLHAVGIETLLSDSSYRVPGPLAAQAIMLTFSFLGLLTVLAMRDSTTRGVIGLCTLTVLTCIACLLFYQYGRFLCNPAAPIGALLLAALFGVYVRREIHARV